MFQDGSNRSIMPESRTAQVNRHPCLRDDTDSSELSSNHARARATHLIACCRHLSPNHDPTRESDADPATRDSYLYRPTQVADLELTLTPPRHNVLSPEDHSTRCTRRDSRRDSLPFQQFQVLLTLFSKFFSSFPHGTCSLSVSTGI